MIAGLPGVAAGIVFTSMMVLPAAADGGAGADGLAPGAVIVPGGAGGTGPNGGSGGNGQSTGTGNFFGAGGGGGGAGGGAGGSGGDGGGSGTAGGQTPGAAGQNNTTSGGAGGGAGGSNGQVGASLSGTGTTGQSGGAGGSNPSGGIFGVGGGGGEGGYGAVVTGATTNTNSVTIRGGTGGAGGASDGFAGASGGDGGVGVFFQTAGATLTNSGSINGGAGGIGGAGYRSGGSPGPNGAGGAGVVGSGLTITNSGTIAGGLAGDGVTQANAITFTGGANFLDNTGGTLTGNIGVTGSLTFNQASAGTISNVITGGGSVTQGGTGALTLSGTNTYTGGTSISGGDTLVIGNNSALGTGTLNLAAGSILTNVANNSYTITNNIVLTGDPTFTPTTGTTQTFSGVISGATGVVNMNGAGTLVLSGANTYAGGTAISNGGTLQVTNSVPGTSSSVGTGSVTLTGGTFQAGANNLSFNNGFFLSNGFTNNIDTNGNALTLTGAIADTGGAGTLTKIGAGTLTLSNNSNNYSGGTSLNAGAIQVGAANALGAGTLAMANGTTLQSGAAGLTIGNAITLTGTDTVDSNGNSMTLSGAIGGAGALTKIGTGTLVLTGADNYSGGTTINSGTLVVNGSIADPIVNSGGTLAGTGSVGATTVNSGGTLAPGPVGGIGTLTINGSVTFNSGSIYAVAVSPSAASSTIVTGTASLTGGTVQATYQAGSYLTKQYIILQSGGLGGTQFAGLTNIGLAGFRASLGYAGNDVMLDLTAQLGGDPGGFNRNQQNVATALNAFFNNGGALPPGFTNLFNLSAPNLANALTQLSGEAATGAQQSAFQMMTEFLRLMLDPFVDGRGGAGGTGGVMGFAPDREDLPPELASAYAAVFKAPVVTAAPFEARWSLWGGAYGGVNHTAGDPTVAGTHDLTASTGGFAAGADYRLSPFTALGFAFAGGGTGWNVAQGVGGGRSDAFQAGVYGKTTSGPAYVAASFAYAEHWMTTSRTSFALDQLTANFNAQSYGGRVEAGYRVVAPVVAITPYAAVQAQAFVTPTYSENDTSGGGFGLAYAARTATDTRGEAGARFDHAMALDPTTLLMLRAKLGYAHDWASDASLGAVFQALPGASFVVNGATLPSNLALASAGAELRFANGWSLAAKFDGEFAGGSQSYAATGMLRYTW